MSIFEKYCVVPKTVSPLLLLLVNFPNWLMKYDIILLLLFCEFLESNHAPNSSIHITLLAGKFKSCFSQSKSIFLVNGVNGKLNHVLEYIVYPAS